MMGSTISSKSNDILALTRSQAEDHVIATVGSQLMIWSKTIANMTGQSGIMMIMADAGGLKISRIDAAVSLPINSPAANPFAPMKSASRMYVTSKTVKVVP
jgi:hypothetical protein